MVAEPWSPQSGGSAAPGSASAAGPARTGAAASAGAAPGPEADAGFELIARQIVEGDDGDEVSNGWYRIARTLRKLFRLRRTWAALGTHLKNFTGLKPPERR